MVSSLEFWTHFVEEETSALVGQGSYQLLLRTGFQVNSDPVGKHMPVFCWNLTLFLWLIVSIYKCCCTHKDFLFNTNGALAGESWLEEVQSSACSLNSLFLCKTILQWSGKCPSSTPCGACSVNRSAIMLMWSFICCSRGSCQSKSLSDKSI